MKIGTLVKHIEWEYIGVVTQQGVSDCDNWLVEWVDDVWNCFCSECELEVLCE